MFEIKGTIRDGHLHIINGVDQLDFDENKNLFLVSYILVQNRGNNSKSVVDVVQKLLTIFNDDEELISNFNKLLFKYGYNPLHIDSYINLSLLNLKVFTVNDKFQG